jgi:hypothetical protein
VGQLAAHAWQDWGCAGPSQPLSGPVTGRLQLRAPTLQNDAHKPFWQFLLITFVPEQARPHAPQWSEFWLRFASQPSVVD